MDSMICYSCVLKHLSVALSFGKEVMSGHSKGDELDHRIDFIGEIINAEQHLELIDKNLFNEISTFRKNLQEKDILVSIEDLQFIRKLYLEVEMLKDGIKNTITNSKSLSENPDVVYIQVTNKEYFDLSYKLLISHLKNYSKIYVLKSEVDLSEFPNVIVLNEDIRTFMKRTDITPDILFMNENMSILKDIDAKFIFPSFSGKLFPELFKDIQPNVDKKILLYDDLKIQPVNVKIFNEVINRDYHYYLTAYFYNSNLEMGLSDLQISVNVDRPVCCSTRQNLKIRTFLRWNEAGFISLRKELGI